MKTTIKPAEISAGFCFLYVVQLIFSILHWTPFALIILFVEKFIKCIYFKQI